MNSMSIFDIVVFYNKNVRKFKIKKVIKMPLWFIGLLLLCYWDDLEDIYDDE